LKMYANTKGWILDGVEAEAEMVRNMVNGVQLTEVRMKLTISGPLDDEQRQRMLFIAGKCPVHKTLSPAMKIEILLA